MSFLKIIFLDVDGVLNCKTTKEKCMSFMGVDDRLMKNLQQIVKKTKARIVLVSSWRLYWEKYYKDDQDFMGTYLDKKFSKYGLYILDKTDPYELFERGEGIWDWLKDKYVETFVIFDDEKHDYEKVGLSKHWIQTYNEDNGGITSADVKRAIEMLNEPSV